MNMIKKIVLRDKTRSGKYYYKALRGYQRREDILKAMYAALNLNAFGKQNEDKNKQKIYIADLGCGPGIVGLYFYKKLLNRFKPDVTFIDISPLMLDAIPKRKDFHVIEQDVTKVNFFKPNFFDIVVMKQVLDYLPKELQIKALKNIWKILKPGGQFILSALTPPDGFNPSDKRYNSKLNNFLYSEREKILNPFAPIKKYIPSKRILIKWLSMSGFKDIKIHYEYDIPLSVNDFVLSFGLNKQSKQKLLMLYEEIIKKDKKNYFKSKRKADDIELNEKAVVISCLK